MGKQERDAATEHAAPCPQARCKRRAHSATPRAGFSALLPWQSIRLARGLLLYNAGLEGDAATGRFAVIAIIVVIIVALLIVTVVGVVAVVLH